MNLGRLVVLTLLVAAPVAVAQPIIIPLEPQQQREPSPPVASAPPVAPPTAPPDRPATDVARGETEHPEEASQPPPK